MQQKDDIPKLKILIIGDSSVGKTSLMTRFCDDYFHDSFFPTVGVDFKAKQLIVDKQPVRLQIWDTAGQERFKTLTSSYYRGSHGIIVVFDVTNGETFVNVQRWLTEIEANCRNDIAKENKILVGNKTDLKGRIVTEEDAREIAARRNMTYFETSACTGAGVDKTFMKVTATALAAVKGIPQKNVGAFPLPDAKPKKSPCCS